MKIPCKECISFAICNAKIKQMITPDVTRFSMARECDALQSFLRLDKSDSEHYIENKLEIGYARKFFRLPKLK